MPLSPRRKYDASLDVPPKPGPARAGNPARGGGDLGWSGHLLCRGRSRFCRWLADPRGTLGISPSFSFSPLSCMSLLAVAAMAAVVLAAVRRGWVGMGGKGERMMVRVRECKREDCKGDGEGKIEGVCVCVRARKRKRKERREKYLPIVFQNSPPVTAIGTGDVRAYVRILPPSPYRRRCRQNTERQVRLSV